MKRNMILLAMLLVLLSIFTYMKTNELKAIEEENIYLNNKIDEQKYEFEKLKNHYRLEYENRNIVDIKARSIYDALKSGNIEYLKKEVAMGVSIDKEKITFENGNLYKFLETKYKYILRQRYYELSEDELRFVTGYEVIIETEESIYVCIMEFVYQDGVWKLSNVYFDAWRTKRWAKK